MGVRQHYNNRVQNQRRKRTLADTATSSTAPRSLALDNDQGGSIVGNSAPVQKLAVAPPVARQINDGEYIALQALLGACAAKALSAPSGSALTTTAMSETNAAPSASGASSQQPHPSLSTVGSSKKRRL